jgi:hypothetical protein
MKEMFNFFTRHSEKITKEKTSSESKRYKGLTDPGGVEKARKTAREQLKPMIDNLPPDAVIAILGASDLIRTKSTAEIYGDELKEIFAGDEKILVKTKSEIEGIKKPGINTIDELAKEINSNPNKKIILDYPMIIKEFSLSYLNRWMDKEGVYNDYCNKLIEITNGDDDAAFVEWVKSNGEFGNIKGPKPEEVAQSYKKGFERLRNFVAKQISDRPIYIGGTNHSWDLDAFVTYMTHGKIDQESIKDIMGEKQEIIKETEPFYFKIEGNKITSNYRGKNYELSLNNEEGGK